MQQRVTGQIQHQIMYIHVKAIQGFITLSHLRDEAHVLRFTRLDEQVEFKYLQVLKNEGELKNKTGRLV